MPKRFNPFTGTFDYFSNSNYTGDLLDSTSTKIADVESGEIDTSVFNIEYLLQENGNFLFQEDNNKIIL